MKIFRIEDDDGHLVFLTECDLIDILKILVVRHKGLYNHLVQLYPDFKEMVKDGRKYNCK